MSAVAGFGHGLLDLFLAPICIACSGPIPTRSNDRIVCRACWARARPIPGPRCERCWHPLPLTSPCDGTPLCKACADLRPAVRAVRSAFLLDGSVRDLVHALKYRGWSAAAAPLARRLAAVELPHEAATEIRYLIPVPLTAVRYRERGYNQSHLLAAESSALMGRECLDALRRGHSSGSQTTLHPTERRANVASAFQVRMEVADSLSGEHLLLVDDVWTTGATALACCDALLTAGARAVTVLTFARALPELQRHARRLDRAVLSYSE